ncbi:MAG: hypothetical protein LBT59_24510 [Clostridiales bacterium]|nr:hypothetical protein [Clostridiales bacterium]
MSQVNAFEFKISSIAETEAVLEGLRVYSDVHFIRNTHRPIAYKDCLNYAVENSYSIRFNLCSETDVCDLFDRLQYFLSDIYRQADKIWILNNLKLLANRHLSICSHVLLSELMEYESPYFASRTIKTLGDLCALKSWDVELSEACLIFDSLKGSLETLTDFKTVAEAILVNAEPRDKRILEDRLFVKSKTLDALGYEFGITREGIRQITNKITIKVRRNVYLRELVCSFYYTLQTVIRCKSCFSLRELRTLGAAEGFLGLLSDVVKKIYFYHIPDTELIAICSKEKEIPWLKFIKDNAHNLPLLLTKSEQGEIVEQVSALVREAGYSISDSVVSEVVFRHYRPTSEYIRRRNLSQAEKYLVIIERFFPDGIILHHKDQVEAFRDAYWAVFGDHKIAENDKALFARIISFSTQIDQGLYIANAKLVSLPRRLGNKISTYITEHPCDLISTKSVMHRFNKELTSIGISNIYYLSSVLRTRLPGFTYRRNFIIKGNLAVTLFGQITSLVESRPHGASYLWVNGQLEGMSGYTVRDVLMNSSDIIPITTSLFIHKRYMDFPEEQEVLAYLKDIIRQHTVISSYRAFRMINKSFHSFIVRNNITTRYHLFSVLRSYFGEEFRFSRPHIMDLSFNANNSRDILKFCFWDKKSVNLADISQYAKKNSIVIYDWLKLLDSFNERYLIQNRYSLICIDELGYSESDFYKVEGVVKQALGDQKYSEISKLNIWSKLPKSKVELTDWIIYSILNKYGTSLIPLSSYYIFKISVPLVASSDMDIDTVRIDFSSKKSSYASGEGIYEEMSDFDAPWEETN